MKNIISIILCVICSIFCIEAYSQTTYKPQVRSANNNNIIEKITITNSETIVYLKCPRVRLWGGWLSFSSATVIAPSKYEFVKNNRKTDLRYPEWVSGMSAEYYAMTEKIVKRINTDRQIMSDLGYLIRSLGTDELDQKYKANQKDRDFYYFELHFDKLDLGVEEIDIRELIGEDGFEWIGVKVNNPYPTTPHIISSDYSLKKNIDDNNDGITGIYDGFDEQGYKLACILDNGAYKLVYMDSKEKYSHWRKGDVKAILSKSATPRFFKAQWYMNDKTINNDAYVLFKNGSMETIINDEKDGYLKMYPASTSSIPFHTPNNTNSWTGTGFALNNGYIVTNYHVIEDAKSISVQGSKGDFSVKYNASIVASDKNNDIALIKINDDKFNGFGQIPYKLKTTISEVGEDIFVLGYPLTTTMGDEIKLTTGVISSKTGFQGDVALYQISAPIQPGNSGGPLFDNKGNVIGIVNAKHKGTDNVGYAVKSLYLRNIIESVSTTSIITNSNLIETKTLPEKVKSVDSFIFLIECSNSATSPTIIDNSTTVKGDSELTINYPKVRINKDSTTKIVKVNIDSQYTTIELRANNKRDDGSYAGWITIDPNTYISANNKKYKLLKTEGIEIAPRKTNYSYAGQNITFKLYFEQIPQSTTEFDLIENQDSDWRWYGIQLK